MAKSLDELIEYLLAEIAVCGPRGVPLTQCIEFIQTFYSLDKRQDQTTAQIPSVPTTATAPQTVDDAFVAKVWKWLARHPDVSIGEHGEFNSAPSQQELSRSASRGGPSSWQKSVPRIFVTRELTYRAICGHAPDSNKIFPSEYALLSQIAAAREHGILQGELGRITGQDKRSVPKRTDDLHAKGYIVKQQVYVKGTKTSRLVLRRYAPKTAPVPASSSHMGGFELSILLESPKLLVRDVLHKIDDILTGSSLVEMHKLSSVMESEDELASRILNKIIRTLEKVGCIKRVKTAFRPAAHPGDLKVCVQQVRAITEADLMQLQKLSVPLDRPIADWMREEQAKSNLEREPESTEISRAPQALIQWNPNRSIANALQDAVCQSGSSGLTNILAQNAITGPFIGRNLESFLNKISHQSLLRQPERLLHLAIVRSMRVSDSTLEYVYYSLPSLRQAVEMGTVDISAIPGAKALLEDRQESEPDIPKGRRLVPNGSNDRVSSFFDNNALPQYRNGMATLAELAQSVKAIDIVTRFGEPKIVRNADGIEVLEEETRIDEADSAPPPKRRKHHRYRLLLGDSDERPQGRPRKFVRGTEKFWQYHFWKAKLEAAGEGGPTPSKEGVMSDPAGLGLFASRPDDFDETLLDAKAAGLPLPAHPDDITDEWILQTQAVLERSENGAYVSPVGMHLGRVKYRSQVLIVRSDRLRTIDWQDRGQVPEFRFITSSIAHSFHCRRFYPAMPLKKRMPPRTPRKPKGTIPLGTETPNKAHAWATNICLGPQIGVFTEPIATKTASTAVTEMALPPSLALTQSEFRQYMDTTESDSDLGTGHHFSRNSPRSRKTIQDSRSSSIATTRPTRRRPSKAITFQLSNTDRNALSQSPPAATKDRRTLTLQKNGMARSDPENDAAAFPTGSSRMTPLPGHNAETEARLSQTLDQLGESVVIVPSIFDGAAAVAKAGGNARMSRSPKDHVLGNAPEVLTAMSHEPTGMPFDAKSRKGATMLCATSAAQRTESLPSSFTSALISGTEPKAVDQDGEKAQAAGRPDDESSEDVPLQRSGIRKRTRSSSVTGDTDSANREPAKRQRQGRESTKSKLCQKVILELIVLAQGAAPQDTSTIRRCMAHRWEAAGGSERPLMKPIKAAIENLANANKIKQHFFSFRGKGGVIARRAILTLPGIDPTSPQIEELKKKIIDADTTEYVPPEWAAETLLNSNAAGSRNRTFAPAERSREQPLLNLGESLQAPTLWGGTTNTPLPNPQRRKARQPPRRKYDRAGSAKSPESAQFYEPEVPPVIGYLTLKVPGLGDLTQVQENNSLPKEPTWKALLPTVPLKFNTEAVASPSPTALPTPARERKSGLRGPSRHTGYSSATRKIIWAPPESKIPDDLKDLLQLEEIRGNALNEVGDDDASVPSILREFDIVAGWEERDYAFIISKDAKWTFINHTSAEECDMSPEIASWYLITFDHEWTELQHECINFPSWDPFLTAQQLADTRSMTGKTGASQKDSASSRRITRQASGAVKKRRWTSLIDDFEASPRPQRIKKTRAAALEESWRPSDIDTEKGEVCATPRRRRPKAVTHIKSQTHSLWSDHEVLRFAVAVVCTQTLTGGVEKDIDWSIVRKSVPEHDEGFLQSWWKAILPKYRQEIKSLTERFQTTYVDALEDGKVPSADFDDPLSTDWHGIIAWALLDLNPTGANEAADGLLGSREALLDDNEFNFEEVKGLREMYGYNVLTTNPAKEELLSSLVGGATIPPLFSPRPMEENVRSELELSDPVFAAARSTVVATILTPDESFNVTIADERLACLSKGKEQSQVLVRKAFLSLQRDKLIARRSTEALEAGSSADLRTWRASDRCKEYFEWRRMVNRMMLRTAAAYKIDTLDVAFSQGEHVKIAKDEVMDDGVMVAILNLVSQGQVRVRPGPDLPNSRYGIDWENAGYQTKMIDKQKIAFSTIVAPTDAYQYGDPLVTSRPKVVPRGGIDQFQGQIPLWLDVNGCVMGDWWELLLAAVLGLLSLRPGINTKEIARTFNWGLSEYDAELILHWTRECGLTKQRWSGNGWEATEWWWMALGNDTHWMA